MRLFCSSREHYVKADPDQVPTRSASICLGVRLKNRALQALQRYGRIEKSPRNLSITLRRDERRTLADPQKLQTVPVLRWGITLRPPFSSWVVWAPLREFPGMPATRLRTSAG